MIQRKQSFLSFFSREKPRPKVEKREASYHSSNNVNVIYRHREGNLPLSTTNQGNTASPANGRADNNSLSLSSKEYSNRHGSPSRQHQQHRNTVYGDYGSYNESSYLQGRASDLKDSRGKEYSRSNHNISYNYEQEQPRQHNSSRFVDDERGDVLDDPSPPTVPPRLGEGAGTAINTKYTKGKSPFIDTQDSDTCTCSLFFFRRLSPGGPLSACGSAPTSSG